MRKGAEDHACASSPLQSQPSSARQTNMPCECSPSSGDSPSPAVRAHHPMQPSDKRRESQKLGGDFTCPENSIQSDLQETNTQNAGSKRRTTWLNGQATSTDNSKCTPNTSNTSNCINTASAQGLDPQRPSQSTFSENSFIQNDLGLFSQSEHRDVVPINRGFPKVRGV